MPERFSRRDLAGQLIHETPAVPNAWLAKWRNHCTFYEIISHNCRHYRQEIYNTIFLMKLENMKKILILHVVIRKYELSQKNCA